MLQKSVVPDTALGSDCIDIDWPFSYFYQIGFIYLAIGGPVSLAARPANGRSSNPIPLKSNFKKNKINKSVLYTCK